MQNDFLPNFILCNTTQRFVRSSKVPSAPVQKPSLPYAKPNFYCGTQELNSARQSLARLHSGFFGLPHMFSIVRLLGSRSLPWFIRALLDHISTTITTLEPMVTVLQEALPKSIALHPFDGGVTVPVAVTQASYVVIGARSSIFRVQVISAKLEQGTVTSLLEKRNNPRSIYVAPSASLRQVVRLASIGTRVGQCSPANQVVEGLEALLSALLWEDLRPDIVCLTLNELELVHNAL
ncbi:protein PIR [Tanacetum coccineum]